MTIHGSGSFASLGYTLTGQMPGFDPQGGVSWVQTYTGLTASLSALAATVQAQGARTSISIPDGGFSTLTVTWSRDPNEPTSSEVPQEVWDFGQNPYQISIFNAPAVALEAERYNLAASTTPGPGIDAEYEALIRQAAEEGDPNPITNPAYPLAAAVHRLLSQGVEYWDSTRPTLQRTRSYSLTWTGSPQQITPYQRVYTRASLIAGFSIPSDVQSLIPTDPLETPPTGTIWGWRLSSASRSLTREKNGTRVQEVLNWDFAAWYASPTYGAGLYLLS
jgi:hypothetical protein